MASGARVRGRGGRDGRGWRGCASGGHGRPTRGVGSASWSAVSTAATNPGPLNQSTAPPLWPKNRGQRQALFFDFLVALVLCPVYVLILSETQIPIQEADRTPSTCSQNLLEASSWHVVNSAKELTKPVVYTRGLQAYFPEAYSPVLFLGITPNGSPQPHVAVGL